MPTYWFAPCDGDLVAFEDLHDAGRSAGTKAGCPREKLAGIEGMKSIDVLARMNSVKHQARIDLGRQRELDENSVDRRVGIELVNDGQQLCG